MTPIEMQDLLTIIDHRSRHGPLYGIGMYCTLDNTRPRVYRELIGMFDLMTHDAFEADRWKKSMDPVLLDRDFCTRTVQDSNGRVGAYFHTVPVAPYAFKVFPVSMIDHGWYDLAHPCPLGRCGDLGEFYLQGRWPGAYEYARDAAIRQFEAEWHEPYHLWYPV